MALSASAKEKIESLLDKNEVVLFMKGTAQQPRCGFSAQVVDVLDRLAVQYVTVDVLMDMEMREAIKLYGNWPTLPQLYVRKNLIGGCDIVTQLYQEGALHNILHPPVLARVQQMTVTDLKQKMEANAFFHFYDVRTEAERNIAMIRGSVLLTEAERLALETLPKDTPLVFHCHHGGRSQAAAELYVQKGFTQVWNVKGGIDAWSLQVDPSVKRY